MNVIVEEKALRRRVPREARGRPRRARARTSPTRRRSGPIPSPASAPSSSATARALHRVGAAGLARPPRPPHRLVRRRHPARAGDGDPRGAPRQLGPARRLRQPREAVAPAVSRSRPKPPHRAQARGGPAEERRLPARDRGARERPVRRERARATRSTTSRPGSSTAATSCRRCRRRQTVEAIQDLDFSCRSTSSPRRSAAGRRRAPRGDLPRARRRRRRARVQAAVRRVRQAAVPPLHDSKPGWWIAKELAGRVGLGGYFPWKDAHEYVDARLRAKGLSTRERAARASCSARGRRPARRRGPVGRSPTEREDPAAQRTSSRRSGSTRSRSTAAGGAARRARSGSSRAAPRSTPSAGPRTTGSSRALPGERGVGERRRGAQRCRASRAPLENGERVVLVNQDGVRSRPVRAKVTQRIRGDCVYLVHGWGQTAKRLALRLGRGASDSELATRYAVDPIMGGTGMNVNFVRLERAEGRHGARKRYAMAVDTRALRRLQRLRHRLQDGERAAEGGFRDWIVQETRGRSRRCPCRSARSAATSAGDPPCVSACPTGASHVAEGGVVLVTGEVHRLQGLHRRVPVRRALRPPRRLRRQVHLLPAPDRAREGARVRRGLPDARAHVRRPRRSRERRRALARSRRHGPAARVGQRAERLLPLVGAAPCSGTPTSSGTLPRRRRARARAPHVVPRDGHGPRRVGRILPRRHRRARPRRARARREHAAARARCRERARRPGSSSRSSASLLGGRRRGLHLGPAEARGAQRPAHRQRRAARARARGRRAHGRRGAR